jgi:hypothetical protein
MIQEIYCASAIGRIPMICMHALKSNPHEDAREGGEKPDHKTGFASGNKIQSFSGDDRAQDLIFQL